MWSKYIPSEFNDLDYVRINLNFWDAGSKIRQSNLILQRCFDHDISLSINGLEGEKLPSIFLLWGEGPDSGSEKLWPLDE